MVVQRSLVRHPNLLNQPVHHLELLSPPLQKVKWGCIAVAKQSFLVLTKQHRPVGGGRGGGREGDRKKEWLCVRAGGEDLDVRVRVWV